MNSQTRTEKIAQLLKDSRQLDGLDAPETDNADECIEALEEQINETEVIYYSNAIKYLAENDAGLNTSMGLATDMGYEVRSINSELLATLLQQENMRAELGRLRADIEEIYDTNEIE